MKIEDRVVAAFGFALAENFSGALATICPAIEASSRKALKKEKISAGEYKNYLRSLYPIINAFMGNGPDISESTFASVELKTDAGRLIASPDFADIIYHAFRCSLAHGHEIEEKFQFIFSDTLDNYGWLIGVDGTLQMPHSVVWALIAAVVFCEANSDIVTKSPFFFTWGGDIIGRGEPYRFDIDVFWGAEEIILRFFEQQNFIRVAMRL